MEKFESSESHSSKIPNSNIVRLKEGWEREWEIEKNLIMKVYDRLKNDGLIKNMANFGEAEATAISSGANILEFQNVNKGQTKREELIKEAILERFGAEKAEEKAEGEGGLRKAA